MIRRVAKPVLLAVVGLIVMFTVSSLLMTVWMFNQPLWEVLDLLIIPLVLASGAYSLNQAQRKREDERAQREKEIDWEIAQDRVEEAALQKYIDVMRELLIDKNLLKSKKNDPKRVVAKTLTLVTFRRLTSGKRNKVILRFLMDAGVINRAGEKDKIMHFRGEDLSRIELEGANLYQANLEEANLKKAHLNKINLMGAKLTGANLDRANLDRAKYDKETVWPLGFDPEKIGTKSVEE